jgi:hypothetical protein
MGQVRPLPAGLTEELVATMECVQFLPRPRTLVCQAMNGEKIQMQVAVDQSEKERALVEAASGKRNKSVRKTEHQVMSLGEMNSSRLRLQLTQVIPRLEITAAEKARPAAQSKEAEPSGNPDHAGGSGGATRESDRLWHSKHFVWYRLPHLQRLKDSTLVDGVFGPTLDQSKGPGVAEDALLLEVFYDSDSGKLFLEVRRPLCPSWRPL